MSIRKKAVNNPHNLGKQMRKIVERRRKEQQDGCHMAEGRGFL